MISEEASGGLMYAVMGATGKVGGAVAKALLERGKTVRALLRDPAAAPAWLRHGCELIAASADDAGALTRALQGVHGAFVMLPPLFDPKPGFPEARGLVTALRESLAAAAIPKVVCLSTIGADAAQSNLLNQLRMLEEALDTLAAPISFLRPAWFLDNVAFDADTVRTQGALRSFLQPLDKQFPMVAARDVGALAAERLQESWLGHQVIELEGPRPVSAIDLANAFASALERGVRAEIVPRQSWEGIFRGQGSKNPTPRMQMLDGFNEGWIRFAHERRYKGPTDLRQIVDEIVARG